MRRAFWHIIASYIRPVYLSLSSNPQAFSYHIMARHDECHSKECECSHEEFPVAFSAYDLHVEYKHNPIGMDEPSPRFGYVVAGCVSQAARQIQVFESGVKAPVWDSGWVNDSSSIQIVYGGAPLKPFTVYKWRVRVKSTDGDVSVWSQDGNTFETGFLGGEWKDSKWICFWRGQRLCEHPQVFFRDFDLPRGKKLRSARLYATALGCYEAELNGSVVSWPFAPGWTCYRSRVQYQAYDVTSNLKQKGNTLWLTLAGGWYSGRIAAQWNIGTPRYAYPGDPETVRAELRLVFEDGSVEVIGTDSSFGTANLGASIRMGDIYDGELVQAWRTKEIARKQASTAAAVYEPPANEKHIWPRIEWTSGPKVARLQTMEPVSITKRCEGTYIVDFGQNFTGREVLHLKKTVRGATITVKHGEMLEADGSLYVSNLRTAKAMTTYICDDAEEVTYEPTFTFYGFRYMEISGWFGPRPTKKSVNAVVLSSDLLRTGSFSCADEMVNKLFENTGWGLRSNLLDVPTDCPQRDERFGWTGDTEVICNAATYCLYAPDFYNKWVTDLNLGQGKEGTYPYAAPSPVPDDPVPPPGPGWSDAAVIVPWQIYRKYGDVRILERSFDHIKKYIDGEIKYTRGTYILDPPRFGDWLNVNAVTSNALIGTAYLAGMTRLAARIAKILGREEDREHMEALSKKVRNAFKRRFFDPKTGLRETTQCAYLMALHFDLLPKSWIARTVEALVNDIVEKRGLHLSTGFLGTPLLLPVLTRYGRSDVAYDLLRQQSYPSWIYPITQGATTMWERWNSYTKETGFGDINMNSFNHYAYGAVSEWFFEGICGIQPIEDDPSAVAFKRFRLAPAFNESMGAALAAFISPYGYILSYWGFAHNELEWCFSVPDNSSAEVTLPPYKLASFNGDLELQHDDEGRLIALPGDYCLRFKVR